MNKSQKEAVVGLYSTFVFLSVIIVSVLFAPIRDWPFVAKIFLLILTIIACIISVVFLIKKQSPAEPALDERDVLIRQKALSRSFFALCVILILACYSPMFAFGIEGHFPVLFLPFGLLLIFCIVRMLYCASVLLQYRRGSKNGE
jgi:archaellum biogenesis protein FlaJ (TadC family)